MGLLKALSYAGVISTTSFCVGLAIGYGGNKPPTPLNPRIQMVKPSTYDLRLYDVTWQVEGETQYIGLCRGPIIDHGLMLITCLMPRGTVAPWVRPRSESVEPEKELAQASINGTDLR